MPKPSFNKAAIVGVGLIGGSIGMAILKRRLAKEVVGVGRRTTSLAAAKRFKAVTSATTNLEKGVADAELVFVCTPVGGIVDQVKAVGRIGNPSHRVLITDVGSTKAKIVRQLDEAGREATWPTNVRFIGSHPIAGNEKRGPQHGSADLFVDRTVVITPTEHSLRDDVRRLKQFWSSLGARVIVMTPEEHDTAMAAVSHLPHLLASAIAGATPGQYVSLSGSGWHDTTRIAAGDASLWRQILLANRKNVLDALQGFDKRLAAFRKALEAGDEATLERLLSEAKKIRDAVGGK